MRKPTQRQTRKLLSRIKYHAMNARWSEDWRWYRATIGFILYEVEPILYNLPAEVPRPSYYGARGSTRNPFR